MKAVHLHTEGVHDSNEATLLEMFVRFTSGVCDVAAVRSLKLISVLYDERLTSPSAIMRTIRSAGFNAREYEPREHEPLMPLACAS